MAKYGLTTPEPVIKVLFLGVPYFRFEPLLCCSSFAEPGFPYLAPDCYVDSPDLVFAGLRHMAMGHNLGWMNIHLPPILMFTRGLLGFDPQPSVQVEIGMFTGGTGF